MKQLLVRSPVGGAAFVCSYAMSLGMPVSPSWAGTVAIAKSPDDICTSTLLPLTLQSSFGKTSIQPDGSVVSSGVFDQVLANAGFTAAKGWTINYGSFTLPYSGSLQANFYDAWAATPPNNTGLDGNTRQIPPPKGTQWPQDAAGATIQVEAITNTPVANMHFIQMYTQGFNSANAPSSSLDNPKPGSPFYDPVGASMNVNMSDGKFGSWFQDTPAVYEAENADRFWDIPLIWTESFSMALATTSPGPNNTTVLTIWGGYQWGFKATIVESPEPSTLTLLGTGIVGLVGYAWRRRKHVAA